MAAHFSTASQCQIPCCYTCGLVSAGATQGELPKGAREGPLGDNSVAQLVCALLCTAPVNISLQTRFILQTLHSNSQFSIFNSQLLSFSAARSASFAYSTRLSRSPRTRASRPAASTSAVISSLLIDEPSTGPSAFTSVFLRILKAARTREKNSFSSLVSTAGLSSGTSLSTAESTLGLGTKQSAGTSNKISALAWYCT